MAAPDAAPAIALVNQTGVDRSSRLDSATMTREHRPLSSRLYGFRG